MKDLALKLNATQQFKIFPEGLVETSTETIEAETIIWCAGVKATPVKSWINVKTDETGRVLVNEDLSISDHSNIFVIGDASYVKNKNGRPLPGLAPVAKQEGNFVAEVIKKNIHNDKPRKKFYYKTRGYLATIGEVECDCGPWMGYSKR